MKSSRKYYKTVNRNRRAGVLLHPTSFPGPFSNGDLGHQAYRFIEFLKTTGFKVWQMLPLGPTHSDKSPYQCLSAHAGNPLLISLDWLVDKNWLDTRLIKEKENSDHYRYACLQQAADIFYQLNDALWTQKLADFIQENAYWLDDYTLFMSYKNQYDNKPWYEWPDSVRHRDIDVLETTRQQHARDIRQINFEQFIFFTQWQELHAYARSFEIELFGDMPIFVARDSADVWAQRKNFLMDEDGDMPFIAGVPPDAFSDTGQRWGNPLYNWDFMQQTDFNWWKERFQTQLKLFDMVRIDHFRGLQACWQIPEHDDTAINGSWVEVPGAELLKTLFKTFDHLPLIAEDLGVITDQVIELKESFNLSGMKVLQFAFDGNNRNPHLPHCYLPDDVVYTGTHDNDTTLGWASVQQNYNKEFFDQYIGLVHNTAEQQAWSVIRLAFSSVSFLSMMPMQDVLMLDSTARMNLPGTVGDNWNWRFEWKQVNPDIIDKLSHMMVLYQR